MNVSLKHRSVLGLLRFGHEKVTQLLDMDIWDTQIVAREKVTKRKKKSKDATICAREKKPWKNVMQKKNDGKFDASI